MKALMRRVIEFQTVSITVCFVALQNPRPVGTNGGPTTEFQVSP